MDETTRQQHLAAIEKQGFSVLEGVLEPELVDLLSATLERLERDRGVAPASNTFEGRQTVRIYNLLAADPVFARVPVHPAVLPIVEGVLDTGCLISSLSSITILPGETAQPLHADDQLLPIPKPHPPLVCNTMWALTDFTEPNGATRLVPASHERESPEYGTEAPTIAATMSKGSVLIWNGSLWHGGGANATPERRVGIAMNYCAGFIRQQENQQLGIPREIVQAFPPRLQELVGYGVYRSLIGHIDKRTPGQTLLDADTSVENVWDKLG
jgi:ectoine hydroxylase-related dioxygenase (phytanoyl-CoA dioxygenase family)